MMQPVFGPCELQGEADAWRWSDDNSPKWRIGLAGKFHSHGRIFDVITLSMPFGREQDARAAADALNAAGLTTIAKLIEAGPERVRQLMIEALAW